ncbi:peroxide stress protein YaaA [Spartinivicinus ruber]|uniref:peroxide stress protein YaaA n=1 Tax=Spartinivicinus ruber TaxID=2683272 RepID=UPI0013D0D8AC|nr:peroxide stress protein YaaA [Spartinivicinus ruber]
MLAVISPAKTLDFETPPTASEYTQPELLKQSETLVKILRQYTPDQLAKLMKLSDKLAGLNVARFKEWSQPFKPTNAKQAVLAFKGDVYTGLEAESLTDKQLEFAQRHLRILSGLYGVLRPLDLIQPYRLEMGTKLENPNGKDLYQFWGEQITQQLNQQLTDAKGPLINLASNEYFKAVKPQLLDANIITPVFKDWKNGQYKVISFLAKKARGMMVNYLVKKKIKHPEKLKQFDMAGYQYQPELSSEKEWVFTRKA